jgi:hypothetical protein
MTFEAFITRATDGKEVDFERDFEREPVIQIARMLYGQFSNNPKYYALLANVQLPTGKREHTRQVDALLLSEDGMAILDFKNAHAPFVPTMDDRTWLYNNGKTVKSGTANNPYRQMEAQRETLYQRMGELPKHVKLSQLPKPFQLHAGRNLNSSKTNKHFFHFEIPARLVLTGERFALPEFKRENHQRWFDIIWMDDCAQFMKTMSFNKGIRLSQDLLRVLVYDLFGVSPWVEVESLYRKPFGYLSGASLPVPTPLLQASVTLGRNSNLAVFIAPENKEVSRTHAIIRQTPDGAVICDAGSTNGTWLNGRKLAENEEAALKHEDTLVLGKWEDGKAGEQSVVFRYLSHLDTLPLLSLPEYEETIGFQTIRDKLDGDELR